MRTGPVQGASGTGRFQHLGAGMRRGSVQGASGTGRLQHQCADMRRGLVQGASGTGQLQHCVLTCAEAWYRAPSVPDGCSTDERRPRYRAPPVPDGSSTWALACAEARYRAPPAPDGSRALISAPHARRPVPCELLDPAGAEADVQGSSSTGRFQHLVVADAQARRPVPRGGGFWIRQAQRPVQGSSGRLKH